MKSEFIHLHNHSDNSLLDGAQNVPSVLETITDLGMDSVALTEHGNLFGAVSFYKKAKDKNIKPIIGCEVYVAKGSRFQKDRSSGMGQYNHLVLIAQNYQGYKEATFPLFHSIQALFNPASENYFYCFNNTILNLLIIFVYHASRN